MRPLHMKNAGSREATRMHAACSADQIVHSTGENSVRRTVTGAIHPHNTHGLQHAPTNRVDAAGEEPGRKPRTSV